MRVRERTYTIDLTEAEVTALVDALNADCKATSARISELKEQSTGDLQVRAQTIASLKAQQDVKKALRNELGKLIGCSFCGTDA